MKNIEYRDGKLYLLDQTALPNRIEYINPKTKEDYYYAIKSLQVRGAPAIGIFGPDPGHFQISLVKFGIVHTISSFDTGIV